VKALLEQLNATRLAAYRACPRDILEHAGKEESVLAGGYGYRQVLELVQNGADAALEVHENGMSQDQDGLIQVYLSRSHLYVANTGAPLSNTGVEALLSSDVSPKRGNQIGRFGLGFKSLLRLGGKVDVFTRTVGNLRFDPQRCRSELKKEFALERAPGLRLAWVIEETERYADKELQALSWAETIIRAEVCNKEIWEHLEKELLSFPSEFLLFLDHPVRLNLISERHQPIELRVEGKGIERALHSSEGAVRWRVFSRTIEMSDSDATSDATSIHARKSVPLKWATPIDAKREEAGRFWAFFPTQTPTYVPGILNAPWKLNSDRNALVRGEWNSALMREAAKLIVDHLPALASAEDPARHLDALPRQVERQDEDAAPMVNQIWGLLCDAEIVPDCTGALRLARELRRHPLADQDLAERWSSLTNPENRKLLVHPASIARNRASRLAALAERLKAPSPTPPVFTPFSAQEWFHAIASVDLSAARELLNIANSYSAFCSREVWEQWLPFLVVIPTEAGTLASKKNVFLLPPASQAPQGGEAVAAALFSDEGTRKILQEVFGVRSLNDALWNDILTGLLYSYDEGNWPRFWTNLRLAPLNVAQKFLESWRERVRVLARDGKWHPPKEVLLPGTLVWADDSSENQKVLVDEAMHGKDSHFLSILCVPKEPRELMGMRFFSSSELGLGIIEPTLYYLKNVNSRPKAEYLNYLGLEMPEAAYFLTKLSGLPNAKLTETLLASLGTCPMDCKFGHVSVDTYPKIKVSHPLPELLFHHGTVRFGSSTAPLRDFVRRYDNVRSGLLAVPDAPLEISQNSLNRIRATSPADCSPTELQSLWQACFEVVPAAHLETESYSPLWNEAARDKVAPQSLNTATGRLPINKLLVTTSSKLAQLVRGSGQLVFVLDERAHALWCDQGASPLTKLLQTKWDSVTSPELPIADVIPEIGPILNDEARAKACCLPVAGLRFALGEADGQLSCLLWENRLLIDLSQLRQLPMRDQFKELIDEMSTAGWLRLNASVALESIADETSKQKRLAVRAETTLAGRLLKAVNEDTKALWEALGELGKRPALANCSPIQLAEIVLAHHGPATLSSIRIALEKAGLKPPSRWGKNLPEVRAFATELGFPENFADAKEIKREPEIYSTGPIPLPPLHDFQSEVLDGVRALLQTKSKRRRAVVSLPTGGGKTRVTAEAAVRLVLAPLGTQRLVIWIAQSDELCEQAVQAFRQVWLNIGAPHTQLRIARLWGGNINPEANLPGEPTLIVASIQTLNSRMGLPQLEWLRNPGLVVVDECHHAIASSYTNILRWLDMAYTRRDLENEEPPMLGLSATPFRSNDEESERLAARFGNLWFPSNQAELQTRLRAQGVLSIPDNEPLRSSTTLTADETKEFDRLSVKSEGVELDRLVESVNQRFAEVEDRNKLIIDCVQSASQRSILLFANSVNHSAELSARLNMAGIPSAHIGGDTPGGSRRYFLKQFQQGELRVLCNHSVLTTGFDAPRTDMILISRQILSPVRYMQIVGRGLRGEKNGGTARCRIVTVLDNLGRFENRHAYHYCSSYFQSIKSPSEAQNETSKYEPKPG